MGILRSGAKTTGPPTGRLVRDGRSRTSGARRVARLGHPMTSALPPAQLAPAAPGRAWFLRETETLAALDHPTIRHVYAAAIAGSFAYRTTNWVEGESLADAPRRGPRPIPTAHPLGRDLLSAAEHAHARGVILRRIVPLTLMLELSGRAVITDLRYANWCLPYVPPEERGAGGAFVAPEVRAGGPGEPASDVYAVAALVYYVLTGHEPDADPARVVTGEHVVHQ